MKRKELSSLRQKSAKELLDEINKKKTALIKERKNLKKARGLAYDIAQIATLIRESELERKEQ